MDGGDRSRCVVRITSRRPELELRDSIRFQQRPRSQLRHPEMAIDHVTSVTQLQQQWRKLSSPTTYYMQTAYNVAFLHSTNHSRNSIDDNFGTPGPNRLARCRSQLVSNQVSKIWGPRALTFVFRGGLCPWGQGPPLQYHLIAKTVV